MNTNAQLVIKDLRERGARFSLVEGDRILVSPPELLSDEDRAMIREHRDEIFAWLKKQSDKQSQSAIEPMDEIKALPRDEQIPAFLALGNNNGVGWQFGRNGESMLYGNGRAWPSFIEFARENVGRIMAALPGAVTGGDGTLHVIGEVADSVPPPLEIVFPVPELVPPWCGGPRGDDAIRAALVEKAIAAIQQRHWARTDGSRDSWTQDELTRARKKLSEIVEVNDRATTVSNYKICITKRTGEVLEVKRYDG